MTATANTVERNRSDNNGQDGLHAEASFAGNTIRENTMMESGEPPPFYACNDQSIGVFNPPQLVANRWIDNKGRT